MGSGGRTTAKGALEGIERSRATRDRLMERINTGETNLEKAERDALKAELEGIGNMADPANFQKLKDFESKYSDALTTANTRTEEAYRAKEADKAANAAARAESLKLLNSPNIRAQQATPAQTYFGSMASKSITGK